MRQQCGTTYLSLRAFTALMMALIWQSISTPACATEGGGNSYPMGVETNLNGFMLAEGAHWFTYYQYYSARHFKNNAGDNNAQFAHFGLSSQVVAPRLSYVWPRISLLGANMETRVVQPIAAVDLDLAVHRPGGLPPLDRAGQHAGLADMSFSPIILGWHGSSYHQTAGIDTHLKTGSYHATRRVNTGRNYSQFALFYALTWFPAPGWDVNAKIRYATNTTNKATHYRSGDEATIEFSGGWRPAPTWAVGINGYLYHQTTDDQQDGVPANGNGNRGRVNALGPYMTIQVSQKLTLVAKLQTEFGARNKPQGSRVWLQLKVPL